MEGAHSLSNFISQLPRAHVISSLPASPIPDVKSSWGSDPCTTPKGLRLSVRMTQKLHPLGPETQSSRASMCVFKGKELVHMQQRDLWIPHPPPPPSPWNAFLSARWCPDPTETLLLCEGVWGKEGRVRAPLKDHPSHLDFLSTGTVEQHLSSVTPGFFVGLRFSFPGCLYYMAHSSWHLLLVLPDRLEGVQSLWVLFLILSGHRACFHREHSLIALLGA